MVEQMTIAKSLKVSESNADENKEITFLIFKKFNEQIFENGAKAYSFIKPVALKIIKNIKVEH